tara:strand:- start:1591 stop:1773 length:183 start_codon:yes stop_codon:yes gene_type:complete
MTWMIDPDEGWRYGFPKVFPNNIGNVRQWLIEQGYPESRIEYWEKAGTTGVPYRLWEEKN